MSIPIDPPPFLLSTPRLYLRDLQEDDWPAVHAWRSDPGVAAGLGIQVNDKTASHQWLRRAIQANRLLPRRAYHLAITLPANHAVIGWVGLKSLEAAAGASYDIGYCLHRHYWGQGYMTEVVHHLLQWAFGELKISRVYADCDPGNQASAHVLEKVGMHLQGPVPSPFPDFPGEVCLRYVKKRGE